MQVTIQLDEKSKQIIQMSDKSLMRNETTKKSEHEINNMITGIAWDLSRGNYLSVKLT